MRRNEILIRRKNLILVNQHSFQQLSMQHLGTMLKNLEAYGYTLSNEAIEAALTLLPSEAGDLLDEITTTVKKLTGANKKFVPMYPNFPKQVMDADEAELYATAMMHYFGNQIGLRLMPKYDKDVRPPVKEGTKLTVLGLGAEKDLTDTCSKIMASKTSISKQDIEDLTWYIKTYQIMVDFPKEIPHKEVLATTAQLILQHTQLDSGALAERFNTATDVLRLAVVMSDGDVSLAAKTKFRSFKRRERRFLLGLLDSIKHPVEDMYRHRMAWIRLGEKLHPGEYKKAYGRALDAFNTLRTENRIRTFGTEVEEALLIKDVSKALSLLKNRPGDFARRLDHLIRLTPKPSGVVKQFAKVTEKISTPVLLQVKEHFAHRTEDKDLRVVFPKGNVAKAKALPKGLKALDESTCKSVTLECEKALLARFEKMDSLGKVYIDPELKNYLVPFSQRSAQSGMKTVVRGSRFPLDDGDVIRFFIWWKDIYEPYHSTVDVDLSAVLYDSDWNYLEHVSYTNLRAKGYQSHHSGDITSAPNGACEFIDVDITSALKYGGRFIVPSILSYSGQPFNTMPECFGGWMVREGVGERGEIFEASTVQNRIDVSADTRICIPAMIDLTDRSVIWADLALKSDLRYQINVEGNKTGLSLMARSVCETKKPNLYDLFMLHAGARAEDLVENREDADLVFSPDGDVTPFDIETISADYL